MHQQYFRHILRAVILQVLVTATAFGDPFEKDLLANGGQDWLTSDPAHWSFAEGELTGVTAIFDGAKTDPTASAFLVSKQKFGGDISVSIDVTFDVGRYLGVYIDFDQETQSGIWMGTGHALPVDAPTNEIERGYIKTVENGFWVVRATGELVIGDSGRVRLRFERTGDNYSLWREGRMIATYHKPGGYPAGPLQIRLTNARARFHTLAISAEQNN